jgi:7,8-dihydropterin-6-yl-methyl-4-(beta-D-ribofuranosyl)aminobenzene 5'-phosphate synthase
MAEPDAFQEVDAVEVLSLVDNVVDFLSPLNHQDAYSFGRWAKERFGPQWLDAHRETPLAEHGFSMLVRTFKDQKCHSILFDAGSSPETVCINAQRMGIDLNEVEAVVLSHGHYDHFGGLRAAVRTIGKSNLPLIVHEDMFKTRGNAAPNGTFKKYSPFPTAQELATCQIIPTKKPHYIADGTICVTGEIPRETPFETGMARHCCFVDGVWRPDAQIIDDRALVIKVRKKGLVVISGCAHAGIVNTVRYAQKLGGANVYAVLGGFHLAGKEKQIVAETIAELQKLEPQLIVPSHCTGWKATFALSQAFPNAFIYNSVGNLYKIHEELNNIRKA